MGITPSKWLAGDWGQHHLSRDHVDVIDFTLPPDQSFLINQKLYHKSWCIPKEVYDFEIHSSKFKETEGGIVVPGEDRVIPVNYLPELQVHIKYGNIQTGPGWHYPHLYAEIRTTTGKLLSKECINVDNLYDFEEWNHRYINAYNANLNYLPISSTQIKFRKI